MKNLFTCSLIMLVFISSCNDKELAKKDRRIKDLEEQLAKLQKLNFYGYSSELIDSLTVDPLTKKRREIDPDKDGKLIYSSEAAEKLEMLKKYKANNSPNYDPNTDIYGFAFGLNKVNKLLKKIEKHNDKYRPINADTVVTGIRVYLAGSRVFINNQVDTIPDVFMIPVYKKEGSNFYDVDNDYRNLSKEQKAKQSQMILNASVPCPTDCDN